MAQRISGTFDLADDAVSLTSYPDVRGDLAELYRDEWTNPPRPLHWNLIRNRPGVLRGMQVHAARADFFIVLQGHMLLALRDIRPDSARRGNFAIYRLDSDRLTGVHVRPGIVHGFYIPDGNVMIVGFTRKWTVNDEFHCRWDDPKLGIAWPGITDPVLSDADQAAGTFDAMVKAYTAAAS
jgi:dTDP-4-dehydrorhamnose 3,5-epimerase